MPSRKSNSKSRRLTKKALNWVARTGTSLFLSLGLAYAQGIQMNQRPSYNDPSYAAVMDSLSSQPVNVFSIDSSQITNIINTLKENGYRIVETTYKNVVEYGTASDAFTGQVSSYTSDPFNSKIYRILKDDEVVGWLHVRITEYPVMNEFGVPDPLKKQVSEEATLHIPRTEQGKELQRILGYQGY